MTEIRMLEKGENPLEMHIEPPGPSMTWLFVIGALLFVCTTSVAGVGIWLYLK